MRIATRVNAALLTLLACGAVATYAALQLTIQPKFDELERTNALRNHQRVTDALKAATEKLATATQDYSFWDETYEFIRGVDEERYIKSNLQPELAAVQNLGVNALVFQNADGSVKWGAAFDSKTAEPIEGLVEEVAEFSRSHEPERPGDFAERGLFNTSKGIVLAAIAPILKSDRSGEPFGKVISVKFLNIEDMRNLTGVNFNLTPPGQTGAKIALDSAVGIDALPGEIVTSSMIKDLNKEPLSIITAHSQRDVSQTGAEAIRYALFMMISGGVLAIALLWLFLKATVIARIERLGAHLHTAGASGSILEARLDGQDDEVDQLAKSFNSMARQVNELRNALADSAYRAGLSEWAAGTLHNVRNGLAPLTAFTWQIRQLYSQNWMTNIESAIQQYEDLTLPEERRQKLQKYLQDSVPRLLECGRKATDMAKNMDESTKSVLDIVSEFDRYANRNTELGRVDALPVIKAAAASCSNVKDGVEFVLPDHSVELWANGVILNQVLVNVFLNAIEALETEAHPKRVEVSIAQSAESCCIIVRDNGQGMSPETIAQAFQMGASTRQSQRRGLGLHWCANAVKVMRGDIKITSKGLGHGAELRIDLPTFNSELREAA
ncbi:MAG: CHASE4 domain-containing protein [Hyphomicrobium sp.]